MFDRLLHIDPHMHSSALILGPRGTGKTYWLRHVFPKALYFDLLDPHVYHDFLGNLGLLEARIPKDHSDWVMIDEIQKIPQLLNEVHRLIESKRLRFLLTGSSARSLRRKGTNLLAGRALVYYMHPLTIYELQDQFELTKALEYGGLPSVYSHQNPQHYLQSYVQTYLKEEVQQEALTRNLGLFTRFLNVASFSQGEILNYNAIAQEIGANRQTISNFFDLLEDLLIAVRLPVFTKRAKRPMISHPKFYYFDVGVFRALRPKGLLDSTEEISGPALETLFFQHCRALNDYYRWGYDFYYWRTRSQIEVDFILYGARGFFAFEIKRKTNLTQQDFKELRTFQTDYPMATCIMIYGGKRSYLEHDVEVVPFEEALARLREILGGLV